MDGRNYCCLPRSSYLYHHREKDEFDYFSYLVILDYCSFKLVSRFNIHAKRRVVCYHFFGFMKWKCMFRKRGSSAALFEIVWYIIISFIIVECFNINEDHSNFIITDLSRIPLHFWKTIFLRNDESIVWSILSWTLLDIT